MRRFLTWLRSLFRRRRQAVDLTHSRSYTIDELRAGMQSQRQHEKRYDSFFKTSSNYTPPK